MVREHCKKVEAVRKEPYALVDAFKKHYVNADFDGKMTSDQRLDLAKYFAGRKNIPDFGFVIPNYESLMPRRDRVRFNVLMADKVQRDLVGDELAHAFHGNCEVQNLDEILASEGDEIEAKTLIAFGTSSTQMTYSLEREEGYEWGVADLQIEEMKSLHEQYGREFSTAISQLGFAPLIENLCKASDFSKLGCEE